MRMLSPDTNAGCERKGLKALADHIAEKAKADG